MMDQIFQDVEERAYQCTKHKYFCLPTEDQLSVLSIEIYCLVAIYLMTLIFTVYNISAYLIRQRRYKNWLITIFYIFCVIVLISRMIEYVYIKLMYKKIDKYRDLLEIIIYRKDYIPPPDVDLYDDLA